METVEYRNVHFTVWDVGGQDRIRKLWRHYYVGTQGLVYLVDSNDAGRFQEAAEELHHLLSQDELRDAAVLVFANKQDLPYAVSASEIGDKMGLRAVRQNWFIQPCSATTGEGVYEGMDWLANALARKSSNQRKV